MKEMNRILTSVATALLLASGLCLTPMANAQNQSNADAMYNGYLNTYLVNSGGQTYFTQSITDRHDNFVWTQAYEITGVEDAYERNKATDRQTLITNLLNTMITVNFTDKNSTNLSWDTYNDDAAWDAIALARGYQITGNTTFLTDAEAVWNMAYNRGWDSTFGGGIWENQNFNSKCVLSNLSFVPAGVILYQATGDSTYLTKIEAIYAWTRSNLFHTSNGAVNECVKTTGVDTSTNVFNNGLFINADAYLYRLTGNSEYYNDAIIAAQFQINAYPIMNVDYPNNGPFGADQFFRGLSNFARWNNLWSNYSTWFQNNANQAWNDRNTSRDIAWDDISSPTPTTGDILSMETESPMVLEQVAEIQDIANPPTFSGEYEIQNVNSGLALNVKGASKANDAAVVQYTFVSGQTNSLWTFESAGGGYYHILNVNSGLAINVKGASTAGGALIVQYPAGSAAGNDLWFPVLNSDGTYSFYNLDSDIALDDPGSSKALDTQYDQYWGNATSGQKFNLISQ